MTRPRLLLLSQTLPFPPDEGVKIRAYHTFRILSERYEIDNLSFFRARTLPEPEGVRGAVDALSEFGTVDAFPIPQEHSTARLLADHARSVLGRNSYVVPAYDSRGFRGALRSLLSKRRYDLVHVESLDLAAHLESLNGHPIACTHHNVESSLLADRARREDSLLKAAYLRLQAKWTEELERAWAPRFEVNIVVSPKDRERLLEIAPEAKVEVIPNGVDTDHFQPVDRADAEGAVFVGGATWYPNRDALEYYVSEIAPRLQRLRRSETPVTWVGNAGPEERSRFDGRRGVELTGYVDDIRPYVSGALCYIVPLRVGGGTRLKILDAWALGMPVVSTSRGAEGLDAVHGENILLADTADDFAGAMNRVLSDAELRGRLGAGGRKTVEERYSWNVLRREFDRIYSGL